jgi:uncharacterized membrane protein YphA (DoxX/SURF4 family)
MRELVAFIERYVLGPRPIARLVVVRICASLVILGFMSSRIIHADDWLSVAGFRLPDVEDYRQPLALPGLPVWAAWTVAAALVVAGLAVAAGAFTRWAAAGFAVLLAYVALADRFEAFTVSKLAPMIAIVLCVTPSGARASVDAWRHRRRHPDAVLPDRVSGGCVAFFQFLLPVFYCASGIAKARGDWRHDNFVLWSHLHDSYQTTVSWLLANYLPTPLWTLFQKLVLVFECAAPVWFLVPWTRPYALVFGLGMHLMIGLMFGPVIWFSLLMMTLLIASYAPARWLERALRLGPARRAV